MKLLVVEDETGLREALGKSLENEGYLVDVAEDGGIGYDMILTGLYDLIILDVMLPVMDGFEILHRIRHKQIAIPVILLTARAELEDKLQGINSGADDYLTKPFEMEELFARIRMVTRRQTREVIDSNLHLANLTLDTGTYEIRNEENGKRMQLGAKEYQVLEYLMRNAGDVMSREMITEKVWGFDSEAEYNNVDVYISFLRKKLTFTEASVRIRPVRGIGYVLEEKPND